MPDKIKTDLRLLANPLKAKFLAGFFKTGKGEYGEGDVFLGIHVPDVRAVAVKHTGLSLVEIGKLLGSPVHEERLASLLVLIDKYKKAPNDGKKACIDFYLANASRVNNWDLVDLSAHQMLGDYLLSHAALKPALVKLAKSGSLWERRISIIATYAFIKKRKFEETLSIAGLLLNDKHDLIHKAVGWMLREVCKRDMAAGEKFLRKHYKRMPRTMLRYAVERFNPAKREKYLRK